MKWERTKCDWLGEQHYVWMQTGAYKMQIRCAQLHHSSTHRGRERSGAIMLVTGTLQPSSPRRSMQ
eukprot:3940263-Rhodomonas_salina.2